MKILLIICAALGYDTFRRNAKAGFWKNLKSSPIKTVFPALTCPVQASLRTGLSPEEHGISANGFFNCEIRKTFFWEQSSALIKGKRFWEDFRKNGGKVAQICLQQSLGVDSDIIISPAPIHKHHGGMIQDCYSKPNDLYQKICSSIGKKFNLRDYWGPFTSENSSEWISNAAIFVMKENIAELILVYLPHMDYDLQRFGVGGVEEANTFLFIEKQIQSLCKIAKIAKYEVIIVGDYQIERAENVLYPNRILLEGGFFKTRTVSGMLYHDFYASKAFALCDHQIAELYLFDKSIKTELVEKFRRTPGIAQVIEDKCVGDILKLTLVAEHCAWFSYRWWSSNKEAPDYASHVDIHNKPGYDPCELFLSLWPPFSVSQNDHKVKGTHGLTDKSSGEVLLASSFLCDVENIKFLAGKLSDALNENSIR